MAPEAKPGNKAEKHMGLRSRSNNIGPSFDIFFCDGLKIQAAASLLVMGPAFQRHLSRCRKRRRCHPENPLFI
jgi:hypothetical protein